MSTLTTSATAADAAATLNELTRLDGQEKEISRRRADLQRQIDRVYLKAPLNAEDIAWLDKLEQQEQAVSKDRRDLHARIDRLRAQIGLSPWRESREAALR
jgi:predicted  nucleic acid-binding Zn-ribbon protein